MTKPVRIAVWTITILGLIGMIDSFFLVIEYMAAIATQGEPTPCSPSSLVNCTKTVQGSWAHILGGLPNPMFGMLWYTGAFTFGINRILGTKFSKESYNFVLIVLLLGVLFSYVLYLGSLFVLRGVCPFCLTSTTAATLITLAFVVDMKQEVGLTKYWKHVFHVVQVVSIVFFVIGLPVFIGKYLPLLLEPMEAVKHWSFPTMIALVLAMGYGNYWAFKQTK